MFYGSTVYSSVEREDADLRTVFLMTLDDSLDIFLLSNHSKTTTTTTTKFQVDEERTLDDSGGRAQTRR